MVIPAKLASAKCIAVFFCLLFVLVFIYLFIICCCFLFVCFVRLFV